MTKYQLLLILEQANKSAFFKNLLCGEFLAPQTLVDKYAKAYFEMMRNTLIYEINTPYKKTLTASDYQLLMARSLMHIFHLHYLWDKNKKFALLVTYYFMQVFTKQEMIINDKDALRCFYIFFAKNNPNWLKRAFKLKTSANIYTCESIFLTNIIKNEKFSEFLKLL